MHAVIECQGHPAISGTHAKTLELTLEPDISKRATCVLGVAAEVDWHRLLALKGAVRLDLSVDGHHDVVRAEMNPLFRSGERLVVRTSRFRAGDTLAVGADKASADLDRALVGALAKPGSQLHVEVTPERPQSGDAAGVLLVLVDGVDEDGPVAAELLGRAGAVCRLPSGGAAQPGQAPPDGLAPALAGGGLACVVVGTGTRDATGVTVAPAGLDACLGAALDARADIVAASGAAALMAAVATVGPAPQGYLVLDPAPKQTAAQRRALVRAAAISPWPVVWAGPAAAIRRVVDALDADAAERAACLAADEGEGVVRIRPVRVAGVAGQLPTDRRRGDDPVLLAMSGPPDHGAEPRATVHKLLTALAASGVSARTIRRALDQVPGLEAAWTYDELAALPRDPRS